MEDFGVFDVEGFEERMALIRRLIQPKLESLGLDLLPLLERETGTEWYHHVARHLRRSVNPPSDTWVAFNRLARGYKATVHLSTGLSAKGANVVVVVKPECVERGVFAGSLRRNAAALSKAYRGRNDLAIGDIPNADWEGLARASSANAATWSGIAERLDTVRQSEFEAGFRMPRDEAAILSGPSFVEFAFDRMRDLLPLYLGGVDGAYRLAPSKG
jgi:uncharacterized protein YktB (UPF0637 family)